MINKFIFSSVGSELDPLYKKDVFNSWELDQFDSGCVVFNNNFNYNQYFKITIDNLNYKFPNFFLFDDKYSIINKYEYIFILDDDLLFNQKNSINTVTELMQRYGLSVCSLSNTNMKKKTSYQIMFSQEKQNKLLITNFCEMGCMIFHRSFLKIVKDTYQEKFQFLKDYGFDILVCKLANETNHKIGIVKNLYFTNPIQKKRDLGIREWKIYKDQLDYIKPKILHEIVY